MQTVQFKINWIVQFKINWIVQFKINWIVFARTFSLALNKL